MLFEICFLGKPSRYRQDYRNDEAGQSSRVQATAITEQKWSRPESMGHSEQLFLVQVGPGFGQALLNNLSVGECDDTGGPPGQVDVVSHH